MKYLCKVNGDVHIPDAPSRPRNASEWEGKQLELSTPRRLDKGPLDTRLSEGDDLWIWTHEDKDYGNGLGLTAHVKVGDVRVAETDYGTHIFVVMKDVELLNPHFRLDEIPKAQSGSRVIEAIRDHRHHQTIEMDQSLLSEFLSAIQILHVDKLNKMKRASEEYLTQEQQTPEGRALYEDREQIEKNFDRQYSIQEARPQQSRFRNMILEKYHRTCVVTGCQTVEVLQAAHIVPFSEDISFRDRSGNGLLLRADIHLLFDRMLVSINPESSRFEISSCMEKTEYREYSGKRIEHHAKSKFLRVHWKKFKGSMI